MPVADPKADGTPLNDGAFAHAMTSLGPFEPSPELAVAVSGGPDSMALCLLADRWARAAGGSILALTVDHGLREESANEAETVAGWLAARGIRHRVLTWCHPGETTPSGSIQAAARDARYRLLERACEAAGILHLLLAHTRDDQAETVLLRLSKGSGVDGLAAMAAVRETGRVRLLRPLLTVSKRDLRATCRRFGQSWVEDPSNLAQRFARGRLRRSGQALAAEGLSADRLADTARRAGRARAALEAATGAWLGHAASVFPEGYVRLDRNALLQAPDEIALRGLSRCLLVTGAGRHAPRLDRLERLYGALCKDGRFAGSTLGGCRVTADRSGDLLIWREPAATETLAVPTRHGRWTAPVEWDRRFRITPPSGRLPAGLQIRRLGAPGRAALRSTGLAAERVPSGTLLSLPGIWDGDTLFALPKFVSLQQRTKSCKVVVCGAEFVPSRRLTDPAFAVV